jgi:hypothetical protein
MVFNRKVYSFLGSPDSSIGITFKGITDDGKPLKPSIVISLGYGVQDGNMWELSDEEISLLRDMIDEYCHLS